ncbi:MAG: hypothetical protein E7661_10515, partial [Ruminococcaceae bacterium]|nr:hypothetical protein [Oscillospiraceae bacterium]
MKKLLILATLVLALVITVVACTGDQTPEVTTGPDAVATEPGTGSAATEPSDETKAPAATTAPETTPGDAETETEAPAPETDTSATDETVVDETAAGETVVDETIVETPTEDPEVPTEEPEVPTEEPEVPTEEPEVPTEEPEVPTQEPETDAPVDPSEPLHTVEPDFLANYAAQTGNLVCNSDLGPCEVKTEAGRTFFRLTSAGGDPYIAFIDGQKQLKVARYMAISYRTNSEKAGQFFMGSGDGWNGNGDQFVYDWNGDANWNLAIIDLDSVGLTALTDYVLNYARLDFFTEAGAEGDYFDVEYIAFFNTDEYAKAYDFEMHKAPMWDADKSVVAHQSFDQVYYGNGSADEATNNNLNLFHAVNIPSWDFVADMTDSGFDCLTYWGWVATAADSIGQFGYQVNYDAPIFDDAWTHATEQPVLDAAVALGGVTGSRMKITISTAGMADGENTVRVLYKDVEGNVVCLNEITVVLPVLDLQNKFESNVNDNADGTDLQASDLSLYFNIMYGAADPHVVQNGLYQYGGINELYADVDGHYAFIIDMKEACNTALAFVRGTHVVHSVDLPEMDAAAGLYPINNYYETDGNGLMGGAGIYAAIYNGRLNILVKAYDDASRTHIANKQYSVKCEGTELTIADNGETVYFLVDGKLLAAVALSGEVEYEKICDLSPEIKFAQTAVVTLADGTTDTIENTLVASTHVAQLGIAVRPGTMKFSSIKVLGFKDVEIPADFYVPEVKENVALNKPVSADSTEN